MTRALIVGYGSIGQRHASCLADLSCDVAVVSQQSNITLRSFTKLEEAVAVVAPDYVVVANETARHAATIEALAATSFRGALLVEKPLSDKPYHPPAALFAKFAIAYNLRFHPVVTALRQRLQQTPVLAVHVSVGQHLADWRPGRDFHATYSASREQGGGVLRDLSHELDYLLWLFGPWRRVAALGGCTGALGIAADEYWSILCEFERAPIAHLRLSYLDRPARREIVITTAAATLQADLIANTLTINGVIETFAVDRNSSYRAMHHAMLDTGPNQLCSALEGEAANDLIAAIETAASARQWVTP